MVITSAGGGYSRWRDLAVTRWREDPTRDCWGSFCYLRDLDSGTLWSTAWQPTLTPTKRYQAIFTQARAEFSRRDEGIDTHTEISVSPEDDVELRRMTITNRSDVPRTIEVTSYAEVVLAPQGHDLSHPAFSNLFVQTELVPDRQAVLCTRRPRSAGERPPWLVCLMTVRGTTLATASFETDRMKFVGRGRSLASPAAMDRRTRLSGSQGPVLDPVVCIRQVIQLEPNETARVDLVTGVGETREAVAAIMNKYHDPQLADRVFELAWTHSQILLRQLNASEADAQAYARLAGSVIYASALRRAKASVLTRNRRNQSGLWGYGISGDLPIVLVRIRDRTRIELVRQAIQAHAYWRMKGVSVDLVVWNEDDSLYRQTLQDTIMDLIAASPEATLVDKPGGIFVRRGEQMSDEDRTLLETVARVVLQDDAGTLLEQVERRGRGEVAVPALKPSGRRGEPAPVEIPLRDLAYFNGLGGFSRDGREYVTLLGPTQATPAPWVNVIANPQFGTVVSESGSVYTWSENSHEFRLTPWSNDPVTDPSGEAVYLRDEETGRFWSPSPMPARGDAPYVARHGFGYSIFEHTEEGIVSELCLFVAMDEPVKFARLRIANHSGRTRRLSATGYWEWVLGEARDKTLPHVVTELDAMSGALFARNAYSSEFGERIAFVDSSETTRTVTADRTEFLGRNGTPADPAAMRRIRLSGRVGAGFDPCAAMQVPIDLDDGQEKEVVFILGAARDVEQARQLVYRFRGAASTSRRWRVCGTTGAARSARSIARRPTRPSTFWPMAGWFTRRFPAGCGPAQAFINQAERSAFATNCKTPWPLSTPSPVSCANTCCARPAASFVKATCSIGGTHRRAAACARTSRTITSGFPMPRAATWRPPAIPACWMSACRSSVRARCGRMKNRITTCRSFRAMPARSTNTASAHGPRPALRRARPAADGLRRLERWDESGRRAGSRRERLAGLLSLRFARAVCRAGPPPRRHRRCRQIHDRSGTPAGQH